MKTKFDDEIAAILQSQVEHLCNVAIYLPSIYIRAQLDLIGVLATSFNVAVALPEMKRWRISEPAKIEADYANNQT